MTAVDEIALRWSRVEPEAAVEWSRQLDAGEMKRAIDIAVTEWARLDSEAPAGYLGNLDPGPARDHGIAAYVEVLSSQDLNAISGWANWIQDSALREASLLRVASDWRSRNREAYEEWVPSSGLSARALAR
jgi:hypothetical protein